MAAAKRIICVGHAALDRIYRIEAFPPQPTKVRALEHIEAGGGMAANAAVAIARLGGKAELWSRIGDDNAGNTIRAGLKAEQVDVRYVQSFEGARSSTSAIIVDDKGERLIVGQRDAGMPSGTSWLPLERVKEADAVLGDLRWLEGVRDRVRARAQGQRADRPRCRPRARARRWRGCSSSPTTPSSPRRRCASSPPGNSDEERLEHVLSLGPKHAGVTLGSEGYAWRERGGGGHVPAFSVSVTDTTGAGDAFHGAFALMLAEGRPVAERARAGRGRGCAQVHAARVARGSAVARGARGLPSRRRTPALSGAWLMLATRAFEVIHKIPE